MPQNMLGVAMTDSILVNISESKIWGQNLAEFGVTKEFGVRSITKEFGVRSIILDSLGQKFGVRSIILDSLYRSFRILLT
jgi:hypothetical protein